MKRHFVAILVLVLLGLSVLAPNVALACPNCKAAISTDDKQPKAYMYSILFMLGMPTIIFGSIGYGLYQMSLRERELESLPPLEESEELLSRG